MSDFSFAIEDSGEFHTDTHRELTNPKKCHSIDDIINTLNHETYHRIFHFDLGTTEEQDHFIIDRIDFASEWLV